MSDEIPYLPMYNTHTNFGLRFEKKVQAKNREIALDKNICSATYNSKVNKPM